MRDIEVQRDRLREHTARLPPPEAEAARRVIRRLDADRAAAKADLLAMLRESRYPQVRGEARGRGGATVDDSARPTPQRRAR